MKLTAIIAEDDKVIQSILSELLESLGIKLLGTAADGQDAVKLFQLVKSDLIFLDLRMPHFDGYYALEQLRQSDPDSIVIMISAESKNSIINGFNEHFPNEILSKPFTVESLSETISSIKSNKANMISIAIKKTLNGIDNNTLQIVQNKLSEDYHCTLSDCLENPDYLCRILKDIYGKSYSTIIDTIKENLDGLVEDSKISQFLLELSK